MTITTQLCKKCNIEKPLNEFSIHTHSKKPKTTCKQCISTRTKEWQQKLAESTNPEDILNDTFYKMLQASHANAITKKIPFELSLPILRSLYAQQQGKCYYTGTQMTLRSKGHLDRDPLLISMDRKNSNEGYTPTNTVLCCFGINTLKGWH